MDEQFWKEIQQAYPEEYAKFAQWLDEYNLRKYLRRKVKFCSLPCMMQMGIFYEYANKDDMCTSFYIDEPLEDLIDSVVQWFELQTDNQ
jgi:hypothetical protein